MEVTGSDVTVSKTAPAAFPRQTNSMRELPLLRTVHMTTADRCAGLSNFRATYA